MWRHNVVERIGTSKWLHLWTSSIHDIAIESNFADTPVLLAYVMAIEDDNALIEYVEAFVGAIPEAMSFAVALCERRRELG